MDPYSQHYSLNAHWNMCQFSSVLKILVPHSLLSLVGSRVLIGVGNKRGGVGNGVGYLSAKFTWKYFLGCKAVTFQQSWVP